MNKYLVSLQIGSKVDTQDFYADSYHDVLEFFELSSAEVIEISEYLYESNKVVEDDRNYTPYVKFNSLESYTFSLRIPKVKKNITDQELVMLLRDSIFHNGKPLGRLKITS